MDTKSRIAGYSCQFGKFLIGLCYQSHRIIRTVRARHHDERFFSILGNELRKKRTVYGVQKKKKSRELALAFFFHLG